MSPALLVIATTLAAYAGMSGLCLAMDKHAKAFATRPTPARQRMLYRGGWALLAVSLLLAIACWGGVFGPVAWTGLLSLVVGVQALLLTYRVQWVARLAWGSLALSLLTALAGLLA